MDDKASNSYIVSALSDSGREKTSNQDSLLFQHATSPAGSLFLLAVCDGLGGLTQGELASAMMIRALADWFATSLPSMVSSEMDNLHDIQESLVQVLHKANQLLISYGHEHSAQLGTTVSLLLVALRKHALIVHIGDSRIYRVNQSITQLTHDQTVAALEVSRGNLSPANAETDRRSHILLQCIGATGEIQPEILYEPFDHDATYLLCTDGFRRCLLEEEILTALNPLTVPTETEMTERISHLIQLCKTRGESDNISALAYRSLIAGGNPLMATIGSVIDSKYEILKKIGHGGMSQVFLAMDQRLNKQWAIKEIEKKALKNQSIVIASILAEANLMKKLDHPALPRIVDILENERNIQIVMDYIEGEPLSNLLAATGPQKQADVIDWAIQIAEVLEYLHTRNPAIIYRDMKPSNVMLSPNGKIKLIDFGVARENHGEGFNSSDNLGTPGYAAPEQMHNRPIDQRTDIYSLGVSLYQLITGQVPPKEPPFDLYPIRYWNPELSGGLERIIQKCTQVNPDDRYSTCVELIYDLEHYEEVDDAFRTGKKKLLNRFITATGLALFFLIAGFGAFWGHSIKQNSSYLEMIGQAEKTNDVTQAQDLYLKAITIMPYETAPYLGLIETYKDDASFSSEEHEQLVKVLNKNLAGLKEVENYPDLAFETGKLYWFYYDYGKTSESDNQMTRMKSSVRWFQDAFEMTAETYPNHQMARIYTSIGQFNRDITLKVEEASDKGSYITYWQDIQNLSQSIGSSSESDLVQLEFFRLTLQAIETYAHKFKAESVSRQDLEKVFDQAKRFVTTNKPTTEKTRTLKAYLESRLPAAEQSIVHAFAN